MSATKIMTDVMKNGAEIDTVASSPPTPGPNTNPIPIAIPMSPMYFVRDSIDVISATIDVVATYSAPEAIPAKKRLMYKITKLFEKIAKTKKLNINTKRPPTNRGFLPILSDRVPKNGAEIKLATEYIASINPRCNVLTPNTTTSSGMTGIIILKPK